jgi:ABC-type branched-subunit amino acid transport system ATPase component
MLKARGVTRRFGGLVAVNSVDFEIPKGMIAAIIGPNGAGKTTFFNVIAGIYAPTEGQIELDGTVLVSPSGDMAKILSCVHRIPRARAHARTPTATRAHAGACTASRHLARRTSRRDCRCMCVCARARE